ncbi:heme-thiolate peroxidase [Auriculariales sp. MPI-PUGE-AT-0066]|nr:heme-thiolate peroxidase [Auriculariales sp. MPI-PUGE-AT-0066]
MHLIGAVALAVCFGTCAVSAGIIDHPDYASVAGLTHEEVELYERSIKVVGAQPLPPAPTDTSFKLVHDKNHPFVKAKSGDQRGPCPGLNTLASHGYLPHNGVATPAQIMNAVMEGFNMEYIAAMLVTYGAFIVNGNHLTNLISIGGMSSKTGPAPKPPALAGGLSVHGTFEGDASLTRSDDFLGNNHDLNLTLFNHMVDYMDKFGNGRYNIHAAAEYRFARIQESIATNPWFFFGNPRFATGYAESTFPLEFFSNDSTIDWERGTSLENVKSFFLEHKFPDGFHRRGTPFTPSGGTHPMQPGMNIGRVNSYTPVDFNQGETRGTCALYTRFVRVTLEMYPHPTKELSKALAGNIHNFFQAVKDVGCTELFPFN